MRQVAMMMICTPSSWMLICDFVVLSWSFGREGDFASYGPSAMSPLLVTT